MWCGDVADFASSLQVPIDRRWSHCCLCTHLGPAQNLSGGQKQWIQFQLLPFLLSFIRLYAGHVVTLVILRIVCMYAATTTHRQNPDGAFRYITNAASKNGGATNQCRDNVAASYPLIAALASISAGRELLTSSLRLCSPITSPGEVATLISYWQDPWFYLAEGDYPFPSSYIPFR